MLASEFLATNMDYVVQKNLNCFIKLFGRHLPIKICKFGKPTNMVAKSYHQPNSETLK